MSWNDVQAFVKWLSELTGQTFRLPTEAEWEYAVRAGSTSKYSWGNSIGSNRANCKNCGTQWDDYFDVPVGSFSANAWGLHDMHGNVWEWVQDCWSESYVDAPIDGSARTIGSCSQSVVRGGSWDDHPSYLRSASRESFTPFIPCRQYRLPLSAGQIVRRQQGKREHSTLPMSFFEFQNVFDMASSNFISIGMIVSHKPRLLNASGF